MITEHTTGASIPTRHAVLITSVVLEAKGAALVVVRNDVAGGRKVAAPLGTARREALQRGAGRDGI